ncbi:MAG: metal ABC transporter ATP-binding protein [Candidatus Paceibacterota bacterium]
MPHNETLLTIENLGVKFDQNEVLKGMSFFVQKGDVLAIIGPNGSGKSVLFRALLGLVPYSGEVKWAKGLKINYVPQKLSIDRELPLSVGEFMLLKTKNRDQIVKALLAVGLVDEHYDEHHIEYHLLRERLGWLSGGQLQRMLIAWAIIDEPDVLLFDEPTSGIDVGGEETIYNLLKKLRDQRDMTILLISHDLNIVYKYANNVLCVNKEMVCYGAPSEVLDPAALTKLYGGEASFYKHEH